MYVLMSILILRLKTWNMRSRTFQDQRLQKNITEKITTFYIVQEFDESQGVSAPSKDEIFGKVNEITSHYQDINEKIIQQMKSHQVFDQKILRKHYDLIIQEKQGSKLQDQLAARRQRRATKYVEEKQCLSLLEQKFEGKRFYVGTDKNYFNLHQRVSCRHILFYPHGTIHNSTEC